MTKNIEPALKLIKDYLRLEKNKFFVIPEYQRSYSWGIDQCDKLWNDIESFILSNGSDPYFFGTIIIDCSNTNSYSLIDGQQRTTTFLLLLKALLIALSEKIKTIPNEEDSESLKFGLTAKRNEIIKILYKAEDEEIHKILKDHSKTKNIKIIENNSINEIYTDEVKKIIEAADLNKAEESVHKIPRKKKDNKYTNYFRNFKFFYKKLNEKSDSQLNQFAKVFLEKCQVIEIRSWQIEQAITMFNSLNSTGMPLSDADIISAQLYSNAGAQKTEFNKQWESINDLTSRLEAQKIVDTNSILQQFMYLNRAINKEYLNDSSIDVSTPGLRRYYVDIRYELLESPLDLSRKLYKIASIWDKIKEYPVIKLLLKCNENAKLYLASYLFKFNVEEISKDITTNIAECLLRIFTILELVELGYSSSKFKTFLFRQNIKLVDESIGIEEIKSDFSNHIEKHWRREELEDLLLEYEKNLLVYINEYLYSKEKGVSFDFKGSVNIEHIMPSSGNNLSTIREDAGIADKDEFFVLVNKLGNKILLEGKINKSIGNEWFKTKKQTSINAKSGYKDSEYAIAKALTLYPKNSWEKADIEEATKKAADRILNFLFE